MRSTATTTTTTSTSKQTVESDPDQLLAARLDQLRAEQKPKVVLTESELESKLLKLKDNEPESAMNKLSNLPPKDPIQSSDDLINQILDEVNIDRENEEIEQNEIKRLEQRLECLKKGNTNNDSKQETIDPVDELMKNILLEAEISERTKQANIKNDEIDDEEVN
jgi:hypothetical protein